MLFSGIFYFIKNFCPVFIILYVIIIRVLNKGNGGEKMLLSDSQKLERLFDLYERKMYGTAFQILRDEGQAEDAVQDAFIRAMAHIHQIEAPESMETQRFMVKVIRSAAIDIYRKNRKDWENTVFDPEDIRKNQKGFEDRNLDTVENRQMIQRALLALDKKYREVLELRCYFGLSHKEIALLLEVSEDTVAKRYQRAKRIALKMIGDGVCA